MSAEYEIEPVRGLPGDLPAGEHIIWQGSPMWQRLARDAYKVRWVAGYFAFLMAWALIDGNMAGLLMTAIVGVTGVGLLFGMAWLAARSTVYTITNKRVVLRFGIAMPKCVNLPMSAISGAGVKHNGDGSGDIPLQLSGAHRLGYLQFWPHARPWQVAAPQPMLRALSEIDGVAAILGEALLTVDPARQRVADNAKVPQPSGRLVAA